MKKKPTEKSITDIFIGKSQWFNWNKVFFKVKPYDDMVKWQNEADDSLDDKEVWKGEVGDYTLENLKLWVNNEGKLVDKGKARAGVDKGKARAGVDKGKASAGVDKGKAKAGGEEDKKKKKKKKKEAEL